MPTTILHGETYEEALYRRFSEEAEFINKIFTRKTEMSKELILQLRDLANLRHDDMSIGDEAADALEAQQSWIDSLEQNARDADRMYKELETELAAAQAQIKELESKLGLHGQGKDLYDQLMAAISDLLQSKDAPSNWGNVAPDAQDIAWGRVTALASHICTGLDSPPIGDYQLAAAQAQIKALRDALENCRLLAARHRKNEWATHILRFCESGGSVALAQPTDDSALRELLKAERERLSGQVGSIGRFCKSEDDCIDQGIDFAAYEIGLIDSIEAVRKLLEKSNG